MCKKYLCVAIVACLVGMSCEQMPSTAEGLDPYSTKVPEGKMVLVDMGFVIGTIEGKKLHAYRVVYSTGISTTTDHIYVLDNNITVTQPSGKSKKHISVIVENDTFKLNQ